MEILNQQHRHMFEGVAPTATMKQHKNIVLFVSTAGLTNNVRSRCVITNRGNGSNLQAKKLLVSTRTPFLSVTEKGSLHLHTHARAHMFRQVYDLKTLRFCPSPSFASRYHSGGSNKRRAPRPKSRHASLDTRTRIATHPPAAPRVNHSLVGVD